MKVSLFTKTECPIINGKQLTHEETIVNIARVSSNREDKTENSGKLLKYLIDNRHWSPLEHYFLTFEIETSRAIGAQLLRHRSFTFQEYSQRYAEVTSIEPIELRKQAETNRQSSTEIFDPNIPNFMGHGNTSSCLINQHLKNAKELYNKLLEAGVAKECARMILPLASTTNIFMTGSLRSWVHFLEGRDDSHAQKEIVLIAKEIKKHFIQLFPNLSNYLGYEQV